MISIRKWTYSAITIYRLNGFSGLVRAIWEKVNEYYYEIRFSIDTSGRIEIKDLNKSINSKVYAKYGILYAGSQFEWLRKAMASLPIEKKNATLLDLGSGKGRVLCYALQKGFKKVIGVEYSQELSKISVQNLEKLKEAKNIYFDWEIICDDASNYTIPSYVDVVWMFHPFTGPVLTKVLHNIKKAAEKKKLYVVFANPPKDEITSDYMALVKKIRADYPRVFLYEIV